MMFAYDDNRQLISAETAKSKIQHYCPDCAEPVQLKQGSIRIAHFAHLRENSCQGLSESESQEHLGLKKLFFKAGKIFDEAWEIEHPIQRLSQRPDLLLEELAVEIQCSTIKLSRLAERMDGYRKAGFQDWWLLGTKLWPKKSWTALHKYICSYHPQKGIYIWMIDAQKIYLRYQIKKMEGEVSFLERTWRLGSTAPTKIFYSVPLTVKKIRYQEIMVTRQRHSLEKGIVRADLQLRPVQQFFYEQRQHILHLPHWFYLPSEFGFLLGEDILVFRYLFARHKGDPKDIISGFVNYRKAADHFWQFPRISKSEIIKALYRETTQLSRIKIFRK
ncbi:competence protein CoiA [Enterococcus florum]|uniref:Competence protein CoiA n=1 Tax=Enterococcus florum TaxID=2480627 RepID=A0A4P5PEH5_9ENTE|nr:competence protein CoiA family protein [Enterococcus florum]GCF94032.1 competence protein CoiA [Enterococcus florum]